MQPDNSRESAIDRALLGSLRLEGSGCFGRPGLPGSRYRDKEAAPNIKNFYIVIVIN